ncbi:MAG: RNA polymerase sigma factor RpoH [Proteobacteria bacterium]|nr:RNA polymerase sigma factor RpoH [Pseudomonadota bacterium]
MTALTTPSLSLPSLSDENGISAYFRHVNALPMLSVDEEYMLAKRWQEHEEPDAAHKLVTSHLRLVAKIAWRYRGYGLPFADLVSEGNVGLMKAVRKFDPEKGFRLSTYAMWWIRASITEFVLKSWSMVRLGSMNAQKKLFFSLNRAKKKLSIIDNGELNPEDAKQLSKYLDANEDDVFRVNRRLTQRDFSLNKPVTDEDGGGEFLDFLADESPNAEDIVCERDEADYQSALIRDAMKTLKPRDAEILAARWLTDEQPSLESLGEKYGISRERVRQLEERAMRKVKEYIHAAMSEENETLIAA